MRDTKKRRNAYRNAYLLQRFDYPHGSHRTRIVIVSLTYNISRNRMTKEKYQYLDDGQMFIVQFVPRSTFLSAARVNIYLLCTGDTEHIQVGNSCFQVDLCANTL